MTETAIFKNIKKSILADLTSSTTEIKIAVAWFTNHEFYNILIKKLNDGLKVTLVIINDPINNREGGLEWQEFINSGGNLHFSFYPKIMHHKFCIIDNQILYNGSYNWTYYAEKINRENTIRFTDCQNLIDDFNNEFDQLISKHKQYKKVKKNTLEDLIEFQVDKALSFNLSKELEANSKWLTKRKSYDLAEKVLSTAIKFSPKNIVQKLESVKASINKISKEIIKNELFNSIVNKELKDFERKKTQINYQKTAISNKTLPKYRENIIEYKNKITEIKRQEQLLKSLKKEKFQGNFGELRINLKWETYDDLDLHIFDPSDNHIFYSTKEATSDGSKGQLDVDANAGFEKRLNPQENIFWETNPPSGKYKIIVDHFSVKQDMEVPFILSIISKIGKSKIIYSKVYYEGLKTMLVAEFHFVRGLGIIEILEMKTKTSF